MRGLLFRLGGGVTHPWNISKSSLGGRTSRSSHCPHWMPRDPTAHAVTPLPAHMPTRAPSPARANQGSRHTQIYSVKSRGTRVMSEKDAYENTRKETRSRTVSGRKWGRREGGLPRASSQVWRVCLFLPGRPFLGSGPPCIGRLDENR